MSKERVLTADIEAVGLIPDIRPGHREDIHIIHCKDYGTGELFTFFDDYEDRINPVWLDDYEDGYKAGDIEDGMKFLHDCKILIMQNVSGYDALALEKVFGKKVFNRNHFEATSDPEFPFKTMDTYTMSCTLNPERKLHPSAYTQGLGKTGPHSIAAHGIRMGRPKPGHEDWSCLTCEMIHRVEEDVEIGEDFYRYLMKEWREQMGRPNKQTGLHIGNAYWCELRMAFAVARQANRGFAVDVKLIGELLVELDDQTNETFDGFRPHMPQRLKKKKINDKQLEGYIEGVEGYAKLYGATNAAQLAIEYENAMYELGFRASYLSTNWTITKKNGEYNAACLKVNTKARGFMQDHAIPPLAGAYSPLVWEDIPLGNRDEVKQILFKYGWVGVNYNDAETQYIEDNDELPKPWAGKIDDDSLKKWEESDHEVPDWCKGIAAWYVLMSRRTQLCNAKDPASFDLNGIWPKQTNGKRQCRGILPRAVCHDEESEWYGQEAEKYYEANKSWPVSGHWRVPAVAFHAATNTFRMRHRIVVNIPSRGLYGKEMRRIFIAGPGKKLLGCDGAGLELRMLAHFMNSKEYTDIVLNGDIHTHNMKMAGLPVRDMAKTFIYAFLYGSGIPNLARQLGLDINDMAKAVAKFKRDLPQLAKLLERVEAAGKKFGYLLSVDGRWGRIRSRSGQLALHTALNVLLQMTGSLVMKYAHIRAEDECLAAGIIDDIRDFPIVAHVHDEGQMEVDADQVEVFSYHIHSSEWEVEEKREHLDEQGRMWSAPEIVAKENDELWIVERQYHPIGEQYCKGLTWAGEFLGLRCPTAGEYKIADSWEGTH